NDRFVGRKLPNDEYIRSGQGDTGDMLDLDGGQRIVGFSALGPDSGGLLVSYGIDEAQAFADIQYHTRRDVFLIALSTALVLTLTWLGARRFIDGPLGQLAGAANQWQLGHYRRRVSIKGKSEISRVADAFNTMADALERREQELSKAKEAAEEAAAQIKMIFESTTDSVIIADRSWRISYINGPASAQLAKGRDLIGATLASVVEDVMGDDVSDVLSKLQDVMSDQRPAAFEIPCLRHNSWFALNAYPARQGI